MKMNTFNYFKDSHNSDIYWGGVAIILSLIPINMKIVNIVKLHLWPVKKNFQVYCTMLM